jgi:hypothetical protein
VHLSATAWELVATRATGVPLGAIELKGKGSVEVIRCLSVDR